MTTITITVRERIGKIAGRTIVGFEILQDVSVEGGEGLPPEGSFAPVLAEVLPGVVLSAINLLQEKTGGRLHQIGKRPRSFSIEAAMDELREKLEREETFPEDTPEPGPFIN